MRMLKKLSIAIMGVLIAIALPTVAKAETVVEKAARTGIITMGGRTDVIPFSYLNDKKELVGYSLDVANLIEQMEVLVLGTGKLKRILNAQQLKGYL